MGLAARIAVKILMLSLVPVSLAAGTPPDAVLLTAWTGDISHSRIVVTGISSKACKVEMTGGRQASLGAVACAELGELLRDFKPEVRRGPAISPSPFDEPRYELEIAGDPRHVNFEAPRRCRIDGEGGLQCKDNKLTRSQEILLLLRPWLERSAP